MDMVTAWEGVGYRHMLLLMTQKPLSLSHSRSCGLSVVGGVGRRHEAPVWRVTWAHPKFGNLLASCSYDQKVFIWKETNNKWNRIHQYTGHTSSVNCVTWAPHELGLLLATASSDGSFTMLQHISSASLFPLVFASTCLGVVVGRVLWMLPDMHQPCG